jgi:hypothetical protein
MAIEIRQGVFETNSSSTHVLTIIADKSQDESVLRCEYNIMPFTAKEIDSTDPIIRRRRTPSFSYGRKSRIMSGMLLKMENGCLRYFAESRI